MKLKKRVSFALLVFTCAFLCLGATEPIFVAAAHALPNKHWSQDDPSNFLTDGGFVNTGGGGIVTEGGTLSTEGGWVMTGGGAVHTQGGYVSTDGGNITTQGGNFDTAGGRIGTDGGDIWTAGGQIVTHGGEIWTDGGNINTGNGGIYTGSGEIWTGTGNIHSGGDLDVKGDTHLQKNLQVNGDTNLNGKLDVKGDTHLRKNLQVDGDTNLKGNFAVEGNSTFNGTAEFRQDVTMGGNLDVRGNTSLQGGLDVRGPAVFHSGLSAGGNKITDVADGRIAPDSMDAINGSQLYGFGQQIQNQWNAGIAKAGASAAALAGLHPLDYDPGAPNSFNAAIGNYKGETSLAVGFAHYFSDDAMLNVGTTFNEEPMVNLGLSFRFGREKSNPSYLMTQKKRLNLAEEELRQMKELVKKMREEKNEQADQITLLNMRLLMIEDEMNELHVKFR